MTERNRRKRHLNPLLTAKAYARLVEIVRNLDAPTKTKELAASAGISPHDKGIMGALNLLEVQGLTHVSPGAANQRCWLPGPGESSSERMEQLRPYRELCALLKRYSGSGIATNTIINELLLPSKEHERVLGALKALKALGLVTHQERGRKAIWWRWIGPGGTGDSYGSDDLIPFKVPYEEGITEVEAARKSLGLPRKRNTVSAEE